MSGNIRARIMQAAREVAEEKTSVQGVTITLEAVAQQAGLSKPGLMYHYPTKDALMLALVEHAAWQWDQWLRAEAGAPPEELSPFDRHRAYVATATTTAVTRADYWIFSGAVYHPALSEPWQRYFEAWFAVDSVRSMAARALLATARFCADGAWMSKAVSIFPAENLTAVGTHAAALIDQAQHEDDKSEVGEA